MSGYSLKESVRKQREILTALLGKTLGELASRCAVTADLEALESLLSDALPKLGYCKQVYVLDADGIQITNSITREGPDPSHLGRDRSDRPYMQDFVGSKDFRLSEAYINSDKRPSLTAIQGIRDGEGNRIGFLGAEYELRELPLTGDLYHEPDEWRQIKGDPAIRGGLFMQSRVESRMDGQLDVVLPVINELMTEHGVFHGKLHFSSSRATLWLVEDPFVYRILSIDDLLDPNICFAYPRRPFINRSVVPPDKIMPVFELFRELRFADENVYLRAGSLNVCNGMIGLNFSCDGSHYMRWDEFLGKSTDFWFGTLG